MPVVERGGPYGIRRAPPLNQNSAASSGSGINAACPDPRPVTAYRFGIVGISLVGRNVVAYVLAALEEECFPIIPNGCGVDTCREAGRERPPALDCLWVTRVSLVCSQVVAHILGPLEEIGFAI